MSWENDKGIIVFMLVMVVFIIFCAFMAVRSAKKQKKQGTGTREQQLERQASANSKFRLGVFIFFGILWFASAVLVIGLDLTGNLNSSFTIPRIMSLPYELLGIVGGAAVQIILSLLVIVLSIRALISKKIARN